MSNVALRELLARLEAGEPSPEQGPGESGLSRAGGRPPPPPPPPARVASRRSTSAGRTPVRLFFEDGTEAPLVADPATERRIAYVAKVMLPPPPPP